MHDRDDTDDHGIIIAAGNGLRAARPGQRAEPAVTALDRLAINSPSGSAVQVPNSHHRIIMISDAAAAALAIISPARSDSDHHAGP